MSQTLFLLPALPDASRLHSLQEAGTFRATAEFSAGAFAGMGLLATDGNHAEETMSTRSLGLDPPPIPIPVVPIGPSIQAHLPELPVIVWVLAKAVEGQARKVAADLVELVDEHCAFAHAFGDGSFDIVMEFVGEELEETLTRVLAATDRPELRMVQTLHTTGSLTRGFGEPRSASAT